jgi:hypothetical protein
MAFSEINAEQLSLQTQEIIMSAMTINLTDVTFRDGSTVKLNSLYGGIEGRYPTFGSSNQQYGRVNFINNVRYGTSVIDNRTKFDGVNITIGSL